MVRLPAAPCTQATAVAPSSLSAKRGQGTAPLTLLQSLERLKYQLSACGGPKLRSGAAAELKPMRTQSPVMPSGLRFQKASESMRVVGAAARPDAVSTYRVWYLRSFVVSAAQNGADALFALGR